MNDKNIYLEFREFTGLSQTKIAKEIGVTRNYYSMLETGKRDGSPTFKASFLKFAKSRKFPISYARLYRASDHKAQ